MYVLVCRKGLYFGRSGAEITAEVLAIDEQSERSLILRRIGRHTGVDTARRIPESHEAAVSSVSQMHKQLALPGQPSP